MFTLLMRLTTVMLEDIESSMLRHADLLQITDYHKNETCPVLKCILRCM